MKRIFLFCLLAIAAAAAFYTFLKRDELPLVMNEKEQFRIKEIYQSTDAVYRALYFRGEEFIRMERQKNMDEKTARDYIRTQTARMEGLYANARSPYPGDISDEIVCAEEFKPRFASEIRQGTAFFTMLGYVNDRLSYGVCTEGQAIYRSMLALFYCPAQKTVYQVEIIVPKQRYGHDPETYHAMLNSLACL